MKVAEPQQWTFVWNTCLHFFFFRTHDYKGVAYHKLQSKTFTKLVKRLAKQYGLLDTDAMPNVIKVQTNGQLQFLLYKNYSERSLSKYGYSSWFTFIENRPTRLFLTVMLIYPLHHSICRQGILAWISSWNRAKNSWARTKTGSDRGMRLQFRCRWSFPLDSIFSYSRWWIAKCRQGICQIEVRF